jgi:hypothetical protein
MSALIEKRKLNIDDIEKEFLKEKFNVLKNSYDSKTHKLKCTCPNEHITEVNYYAWKKKINKCSMCPKKKPIILKNITIEILKQIFQDFGLLLVTYTLIFFIKKLNYFLIEILSFIIF